MDPEIFKSDRQAFKFDTPGESVPLAANELKKAAEALARARKRMGSLYQANQTLGRYSAIGCVALEITQRCNLDCSLCYLSENSDRVKDIPLPELFRRLEQIKKNFGVGTFVQVTGGDPTLRPRKELIAVVHRARQLGLPPALMTNGIRASRQLIVELAEAGLNDVVFHVDLTQGRKGFRSEKALNTIRQEYVERGRGLPINVMFNTTVYRGNFAEIRELVRFFRKNGDTVRMASFQLQADTGRGKLRKRDSMISLESVREEINKGAKVRLPWETILIGHPQCHVYVPTFEVNGHLYPVIDDRELLSRFLVDFRQLRIDRRDSVGKIAWEHFKAAGRKPIWYWWALKYTLEKLAEMRSDLLAAHGKVNRIAFFIHNFMDADSLDSERVHACSFMVMTPDGPISMCAYNARRDEFILKPVEIEAERGGIVWNPIHRSRKPAMPTPPSTSIEPVAPPSAVCDGCERC